MRYSFYRFENSPVQQIPASPIGLNDWVSPERADPAKVGFFAFWTPKLRGQQNSSRHPPRVIYVRYYVVGHAELQATKSLEAPPSKDFSAYDAESMGALATRFPC
jgi:hypothetical protein